MSDFVTVEGDEVTIDGLVIDNAALVEYLAEFE